MEIIEADSSDPELLHWDARACGRPRPEDLQFWVREEGSAPIWFRRRGQIVGHGYVRFGAAAHETFGYIYWRFGASCSRAFSNNHEKGRNRS